MRSTDEQLREIGTRSARLKAQAELRRPISMEVMGICACIVLLAVVAITLPTVDAVPSTVSLSTVPFGFTVTSKPSADTLPEIAPAPASVPTASADPDAAVSVAPLATATFPPTAVLDAIAPVPRHFAIK